jgi:ABC-2 type transport system ATP-binding protein
MTTKTTEMIRTNGLIKTFKGKKGAVEAVRGVNICVQEGEIFGFLGPNGAGKTTTMRMLSTLLEPTGGSATVAGCDLLREPRKVRARIGYVGQNGGAEESATGREDLVLQGRLYGMTKSAAQARAAELARAIDLESFLDRRTRTYSGGQRRRLDVARGMIHKPALLFLDEPTTGLDPQSRARMWEEISRLREGGTTIFLTTHYLDEADVLCDRLAIIDHGKIVGEGTPDSLKRQIAGDIITLGLDTSDGIVPKAKSLLSAQPFARELHETGEGLQLYVERGEEMLPTVLRLLDSAGLPIRTIKLARPTLDDVFLRMTGRSLRETA